MKKTELGKVTIALTKLNPGILVVSAWALLLLQVLPFFTHRWVEDESWYSIPGYTFLRTGELRNPTFADTDYESKVDTRPPLMSLTLSLAFKLWGVGVAAARCAELMAILATVPVIYLIGGELGQPLAGALAALLFATDNFVFLAARTARPEAWVTLWGAVAVWLALRSNRLNSGTLALAAGLAGGLASNYHVIGLGLGLVVALLILYDGGVAAFRDKRIYLAGAGFLLALAPFFIWIYSSPIHFAAFQDMYSRGESVTFIEKLLREKSRFFDFIGVSNQRLHLPVPLPLRLHIGVFIGLSLLVLFRKNRRLFWIAIVATLPQLLWWLYLVNKTARYFAELAPVFSLVVGFAVVALWKDGRWRRAAAVACIICMATQAAGNAIVLIQARKADYVSLTRKLRAAMPAGPVYGAITFAMAFNDRQYEAFDRTPLDYAVQHEKPEYIIAGDRVMMRGSGFGEDNTTQLRQRVLDFVRDRAVLQTRIMDPFYGDLLIHKVD